MHLNVSLIAECRHGKSSPNYLRNRWLILSKARDNRHSATISHHGWTPSTGAPWLRDPSRFPPPACNPIRLQHQTPIVSRWSPASSIAPNCRLSGRTSARPFRSGRLRWKNVWSHRPFSRRDTSSFTIRPGCDGSPARVSRVPVLCQKTRIHSQFDPVRHDQRADPKRKILAFAGDHRSRWHRRRRRNDEQIPAGSERVARDQYPRTRQHIELTVQVQLQKAQKEGGEAQNRAPTGLQCHQEVVQPRGARQRIFDSQSSWRASGDQPPQQLVSVSGSISVIDRRTRSLYAHLVSTPFIYATHLPCLFILYSNVKRGVTYAQFMCVCVLFGGLGFAFWLSVSGLSLIFHITSHNNNLFSGFFLAFVRCFSTRNVPISNTERTLSISYRESREFVICILVLLLWNIICTYLSTLSENLYLQK